MTVARYLALLLALLITGQALGTERVAVDPYIKAGPGYTAATGSITGYVPSKSNQQLLMEAQRKGWLGPAEAKTPITVKPKISVPVGAIGGALKSALRTNAGQLAMSAAISAALAGVGWVMSDDNTKVQKRQDSVDGIPVSVGGTRGADACSYPAAEVLNKIKVVTSEGVTYAIGVWPSGASAGDGVPSGYRVTNNCTSKALGYKVNPASGLWPVAGVRTISIQEVQSVKRDLTDSDLNQLDPWLSAQTAPFLRDLLKDTCEGSLNPQGCYDDLQKQSRAIIAGPASVQGPKQTTTGLYNRPDGTVGNTSTTTSTTYNIRYGDTYFDYDTVVTKTTTQDGIKTGEETTSDKGVPQEKPKDEKEQEEKPKRLASGEPCDVPLSCSGDAIDCAVLTQEKALRCAYEKQSDYEKHKADIKAAVTGNKFEIDDSTEIQIPSFINQGTRFLPASCPADKTFSLITNGGRTFAVTYGPLCAAATDLGYLIVIAVGAFCVLYVGRSLGGE